MAEILVNVVRGSLVESQHRGYIAVCNRDGVCSWQLGDPDYVTYWRSAAKPFQAIPLIERGAIGKFNLTGPEIALMTSSHGGEEEHVNSLRRLLAKFGFTEDCLDCGSSEPMYRPAADSIVAAGGKYIAANNACSGKHSGMLALSLLLKIPFQDYIRENNPIQKLMLETISQCADISSENIILGIDGCGVPVFGLPLRNMALAYARLAAPQGYFGQDRAGSLATICKAMTEHPFYVAGTGRLDTVLMEVTRGKLVAKLGAEGVYCVGVVGQGVGIALKIEDGNYRAIDPVIIHLLRGLGYLSNSEFEDLKHLWRPKLKNHRGEEIGYIKAAFNI